MSSDDESDVVVGIEQVVAQLDQVRAHVRDDHPDRSERWRDTLILRLLHHQIHNGDMTGAPVLPES